MVTRPPLSSELAEALANARAYWKGQGRAAVLAKASGKLRARQRQLVDALDAIHAEKGRCVEWVTLYAEYEAVRDAANDALMRAEVARFASDGGWHTLAPAPWASSW